MRRHRANGVVDLINKYALVLYNACNKKLLDGEITTENTACYPEELTFEAKEGKPVGVTQNVHFFDCIVGTVNNTD